MSREETSQQHPTNSTNTHSPMISTDTLCNNNNITSHVPKPVISLSQRNVHIKITEITPGIFKNKQCPIIINELGIEGGDTKSQGNFIFFGIANSNTNDHSYDILLGLKAETTQPTELFYILYDSHNKTFILKSLTKEFPFSLIVSAKKQIVLDDRQKNYFSLGKICISIYSKIKEKTIDLVIKKGESIPEKQRYTFTQTQFPITIGSQNCSVNIKCASNSISEHHASIDYDKENKCFFFEDHNSSQGSNLLIKNGRNLHLNGEQTFNINNQFFSIQEIVR